MDRAHFAVFVSLPLCSGGIEPQLMGGHNVVRHILGRNDVVLERIRWLWRWDASQYPEERGAEIAVRFHADATRLVSGQIRLYLNVYESGAIPITAENVNVGCIAEGHNCRIASAAELACNKELARVTSECLIVFHNSSAIKRRDGRNGLSWRAPTTHHHAMVMEVSKTVAGQDCGYDAEEWFNQDQCNTIHI